MAIKFQITPPFEARIDRLTALRVAYIAARLGITPEAAAMLAALVFGEARA
jgi:hypothetical protein